MRISSTMGFSRPAAIPASQFKQSGFPLFTGENKIHSNSAVDSLRLMLSKPAVTIQDIPKGFSYNQLVQDFPKASPLLDHAYTRFDNKEIIEERKRSLKIHHEYWKQHGIFSTSDIRTPEREALRTQIIDQLYGLGAPSKNREAFFLIGSPGAGKSTIGIPLALKNGALRIDGDDIRGKIPEYKTTQCHELVSQERRQLHKRLIDKAAKNGDNMVLSWVPDSVSGMEEKIKALKAQDYKVHLIFVNATPETALARILRRFRDTGRLGVVFHSGIITDQASKVFETLKKGTLHDSIQYYDNNPTLLSSKSRL